MQIEIHHSEMHNPIVIVKNPIPSIQRHLDSSNRVQKNLNTYQFAINLNQVDDLAELIKCFGLNDCRTNDIIQKLVNNP